VAVGVVVFLASYDGAGTLKIGRRPKPRDFLRHEPRTLGFGFSNVNGASFADISLAFSLAVPTRTSALLRVLGSSEMTGSEMTGSVKAPG
jgi:hypothetical protein